MTKAAAGWRPIGAVLVESGAITQAQLDAALAEQRLSGKRLGEILIDSGAITWLALAHAIAEQAQDVDPAQDTPELQEPIEQPAAPPVSAPAPVVPVESVHPDARLQTVEAMLKDRQRAFLELVSTTETLRRTVARLKDELAARDTEIAKLRSAYAQRA
ncbi:MAG TPA: hypothetical protein VE269_05870 [Gaiellaceae bacterium]|nr:hypothetical protein [Gaiellaceae bacterium]